MNVVQSSYRIVAGEFGLGDTLLVKLEPGAVQHLMAESSRLRVPLGLFIDGWFLRGIAPLPEPGSPDTLRFVLDRTDDNKDAWNKLLGRRFLVSSAPVPITVGLEDGSEVARSTVRLHLQLMHDAIGIGLLIVLILFLGTMGYLAFRTPMLRESPVYLPGGKFAAFSLGRTQMAFWFVCVVVAYLFIWAVTGTSASITTSVLTLMGIGTGTALGARIIDDGKMRGREVPEARVGRQEIQEMVRLVSMRPRAQPREGPGPRSPAATCSST